MKIKMKRKFGMLISLVALVFFIGACGKTETTKEAAKDNGKTELKITWRDTGENDNLRKFLEKDFIPKFEKENPDIKLVLAPIQATEGDYFAKVALAMQSESTAPDIVAEDSFQLNADASAGYLLPLDDYVSSWDDWANYTENLKAGSIAQDGKLYAIPGTSDSRGLWYNKEVFKKAGLPENWQPKSWDEIIAAAEAIKEKVPDAIPLSMGVAKANGESVTMQTFLMFLYGTNDVLYDTDSKKWVTSSQGFLDSLTFIDEVFNQKKVGPSLSVAMNSNYGSVMFQDKLPNGKAGIILDGFWASGNYTENGAVPIDDVESVLGFAAMPTQNGQNPGTVTMSGGWTWAIPAKSKNHDAAWKVITALGAKDAQADRAILEGNLTVRNDSAELPSYKDRPFMKEATSFLANAHFRPANDKYPKVSVEIQAAVEAVASGTKSPKEAMKDYERNVTRIVGEENTESK